MTVKTQKFTYIIGVKSSLGNCPGSHPYAFQSGSECCESNKDKDDKDLTIKSTECKTSALLCSSVSQADNTKKEFCKNAGNYIYLMYLTHLNCMIQ